jgi:hypothetical protein
MRLYHLPESKVPSRPLRKCVLERIAQREKRGVTTDAGVSRTATVATQRSHAIPELRQRGWFLLLRDYAKAIAPRPVIRPPRASRRFRYGFPCILPASRNQSGIGRRPKRGNMLGGPGEARGKRSSKVLSVDHGFKVWFESVGKLLGIDMNEIGTYCRSRGRTARCTAGQGVVIERGHGHMERQGRKVRRGGAVSYCGAIIMTASPKLAQLSVAAVFEFEVDMKHHSKL